MEKSLKAIKEEQKRETAVRIKREREILGLTQEQLAERMGMTVDNYKKIEEGINGMSIESLRKIATTLGVSFDYLLDGKQQPLEQIAKQVNALEREEQIALLMRLASNLSRMEFDEKTIENCIGTKELSLRRAD